MDDNQNAVQIPKKETRIILFDKRKNIKYFGKCRISVNLIDGFITITLKDEVSTEILCYFDRKFIMKENWFCVINNKTNKNMVIFYSSNESCAKVFDAIINFQRKESIFQSMNAVAEEILFKEDFFVPILKEIQKKSVEHFELKSLMLEFVQSLEDEERKTYLNLIAEITLGSLEAPANSNEDNIIAKNLKEVDTVEIDDDGQEKNKNSISDDETAGSALFTDFDGNDDFLSDIDGDDENDDIFTANNNISANNITMDDDDITCSNINDCNTSGRKYNLRKRSFALRSFSISDGDSDDNDFEDDLYKKDENYCNEDDENIDLDENQLSFHEFQNLDLSNHEFVEYSENGSIKKKLLIFTSEEKTSCYVYVYDRQSKLFKCNKCFAKKLWVSIKVLTKNDGTKKLEKGKNDHICQSIAYSPDDYKPRKAVYLPDYEFIEKKWGEKVSQKLIIFDFTNKKLCYQYSPLNGLRTYRCKECFKNHGCNVYANLINSKSGDYIELGRTEHKCDLKDYMLLKNPNFKTVQKPNFGLETYLKENGKERKILTIYDSSDRNLMYKYNYNIALKRFVCSGCHSKRKHVSAKIIQDENGIDCVQLSNSEHVCQPKPAHANKNSTFNIVHLPNFVIETFLKNDGNEKKTLTIFNSQNNLVYKYRYNIAVKRFFCNGCNSKGKYASAKLIQDENGIDCIQLSNTEHACQPKPAHISTFKIVHAPNFEIETFFKNDGNERKILWIYDSSDKNLMYKYNYNIALKRFLCSGCNSKRKYVSAKLIQDENGIDCVQLSNSEHICQPIAQYKGNTNKSFIHKPNFNLITIQMNGSERRILEIYNLDDKTLFYKYVFNDQNQRFVCCSCRSKKKYVPAKLCRSEKGEEYVELSTTEHICEPMSPNKFVEKPDFEMFIMNLNGRKTEKCKIFMENDIEYVYTYCNSLSKFKCKRCERLGKHVTAELQQNEDGKERLKLSKNDHVCEPLQHES